MFKHEISLKPEGSKDFKELKDNNIDILYQASGIQDELGMNQLFISIIRDCFEELQSIGIHTGGIVIDVKPERIIYLSSSFQLESLLWRDEYRWARRKKEINYINFIFNSLLRNYISILIDKRKIWHDMLFFSYQGRMN